MLSDFTKLNTFITVVKEKSFSKASSKLGISQPAVTQQMRFLENYLDATIVDRKKNGISLTKEGEKLYSIAQKIEKVIANGEIYYVSDDAKYLMHGNVYDLDNQMVNVTGEKKAKLSQDKIVDNMDKLIAFEKDMIIYKAPQEKHVITVFTDTSCGYCQKLHSEMADYNKLGITVRYLAFPRSGTSAKSSTYNKMVSIWCADDPNKAMDDAKKHSKNIATTCKNTVKEQYQLGLFLGVSGTPAILLEDGTLAPGYIPPARLAKML